MERCAFGRAPAREFRQCGDVATVERIEEHLPGDLDVARYHARDQLPPGRRDRDRGAAFVVDYTSIAVTDAVSEPVDVVLNLVAAPEQDVAGLTALVAAGGVIVSTTSPAQDDPERGVRAASVFARSDADGLATIVGRVDSGELRVDVGERYPLSDLARVHELGASGKFRGKVLLTPAT